MPVTVQEGPGGRESNPGGVPHRKPPVPLVKPGLAQAEAELLALEDLLWELYPRESMVWKALVNALVMEGEQSCPRPVVINSMAQAIASLGGQSDVVEGLVLRHVRLLLQALALPPEDAPPPKPGETRCTYSFGFQMCSQVTHLRNAMGLSKLYVYRHLRDTGTHMPGYALMQCISSMPSAEQILREWALTQSNAG
jgi:hypothetical protein